MVEGVHARKMTGRRSSCKEEDTTSHTLGCRQDTGGCIWQILECKSEIVHFLDKKGAVEDQRSIWWLTVGLFQH
jgi:hypothetical protein